LTQKTRKESLQEAVLRITNEQKPGTVSQLAQQVHEQFPSFSEREIFEAVVGLQNEDKLHFTREQIPATNLTAYLTTYHASWYWTTLAVTAAAIISVFMIPEDAFPLVIIRYVLGTIFILWLPGYAFIKTLFPEHLPFTKGLARTLDTPRQNLEIIERIVLSVGMSLALVPIVGLLLNYTPWGIRLAPITLSLTALTLALATGAIIREYQTIKA
jgi:hypothetical protein